MTLPPHDDAADRRRPMPPRRPLPRDGQIPGESPRRHSIDDPPVPPRPPVRRGRHAAPEPGPYGPRPGESYGPAASTPADRRPRGPMRYTGPRYDPPRHGEGPVRRRRPPNHGVPPDENPTDVFDLDLDEPDDDLIEEDVAVDDGFDADDEDDHRAVPEYFDDERDDTDPPVRSRRGRFLRWVAALGVLALIGGAGFYGAHKLLGFGYDDYEGAGESDVLLEVKQGQSTGAIAAELERLDVVASAKAFVKASEGDKRVLGIQPGYYVLKTKMSGVNAVTRLVAKESRVGEFQLPAGTQLDDIKQPDGSVTPGAFTLLSQASCAELNGKSTCVPVEELREVAESADLTELGVPEWAAAPASKAKPARKLEGLIAPGVYDVRPGWDARQLLSEVLHASAERLQAAGLPDAAGSTPFSPYQVLIIASLVEREAVKADFDKIAAVIHNRIDEGMRLEMDSTVNYALDRPEIRTKAEDRQRAGPYNTYQIVGLPPTPISAPSTEAIAAAEDPAQTDALFFVKCEENGLSCFAKTYEEHRRNVRDAQDRGVF